MGLSATTRAGLAVSAVLMLTACGQTPAAQTPAATAAAPAPTVEQTATTDPPSTETPTPTAQRGIGPSGDFVAKFKDVDGYTFDLAVALNTRSLGETVSNDKPGFMSAEFEITFAMKLINTTAGRTVAFKGVNGVTKPLGHPKFLVSALWEAGSPICVSAAKARDRAPEACGIMMGYGYADTPTAERATNTLKVYKGEPSGHFTAGMAGFAESDWPAIKEAMGKPASMIVSYDGGDYRRFDCPMHSKLGVMVGASTPGYECGAVAPELVKHPAT